MIHDLDDKRYRGLRRVRDLLLPGMMVLWGNVNCPLDLRVEADDLNLYVEDGEPTLIGRVVGVDDIGPDWDPYNKADIEIVAGPWHECRKKVFAYAESRQA